VASDKKFQPIQLRWLIVVSTAVVLALGLVLLFLLTQATDNRELYEHNYRQLLFFNMVVAALLAIIIAWLALRLAMRLRRGKFGSRLLIKIAATFALVGFLPGLLIYGVSYQFVSRSIESWFDVKVEGALDAGLSLGRASIDNLSTDLVQKSRLFAAQLASAGDAESASVVERILEQMDAEDVVYWSANGQAIASAGASRFSINPSQPTPAQIRQTKAMGAFSQVDGLDDSDLANPAKARIQVFVWVNPSSVGLVSGPRILQVTKGIPATLVHNALAVETAYREYQERALGRDGLRSMYIGTLTLTLFLAVFGAVLLAVLLGNQLARPLLLLAAGVREVAAGDLSPKPVLQGRDELEGLTRSFAEMTQQLLDTRTALGRSMEQVNTSRANLQTILDNLTAGVLVLDDEGLIRNANPGATRILRIPVAQLEGHRLQDMDGLADFGSHVQREFDSFWGERSQHGLDHWQQSFELNPNALSSGMPNTEDGKQTVTLLARGAVMPNNARLLVFDDISQIVSAQRAQAWGEVARRLAHEIKNPLTPIQLSAERLEIKLTGKLPEQEQSLLNKSVKTIVDQVDAMKRLVNEFRDYARLPLADLQPLNLNDLVQEVLQLYGNETALVPVQSQLDNECPSILGDAQQLRQVVHNLLQNAQDATQNSPHPTVSIATQWVPESSRVRLVVRDNGPGFAPKILVRAFEPYVTTKSKGTGLGLAVVKKIAEEHNARIDIKNREEEGCIIGAQVSLSFKSVQTRNTI
jgi:nitrogen fixation/metabolism regulation signal transduction histidine kinase